MGNPAVLVAGPGLSPMGIAATVSRAPSDADDTLDVHWLSPRDGTDGEEAVRERDLRWVSTARLPAVDDEALLFVDSLGDPWAFVWATGAALVTIPAIPAVKRGTKTMTFTASTVSATETITHGLGTTPAAVTLGSQSSDTKGAAFNYTATTFDLIARCDSSLSGTKVFAWVAVA